MSAVAAADRKDGVVRSDEMSDGRSELTTTREVFTLLGKWRHLPG